MKARCLRNMTVTATMVSAILAVGCGAEGAATQRSQPTDALTVAARAGAPFVKSTHGKFAVQIEWLSGELKVREDGSARLSFLSADGNAAAHARVDDVRLWMPVHGHGSAVDPQVNQVAAQPADVVELTSIQVQMSGDWEMHLSATVDGQSDTAILAFQVP